ncbi:MAG: hypothetical protein IT323_08450 [Anaerolineae bacterium]|nr:hypothetical protein [Anaerolineae bacterium]
MFGFGWRVAALIFAALTVILLGVVILARRAEAQSGFALLFTYPDGAPCDGPCLLGVRPGETMLDDAVHTLREHPLTRDMVAVADPARDGMLFGGASVGVGLIGDSEGRLALVDILLEPPALLKDRELPPSPLDHIRLEAILAALGTPDYVEFTASSAGPMLQAYYQERRLFILTQREDESRIYQGDALVFMYVSRQEAPIRPSMYPWSGLGSVRRYFDAHFGG